MRVTDDNLADVARLVRRAYVGVVGGRPDHPFTDGHWRNGETPAAPGDWVLRLPDSRWQVVSDDTFRVEWMVAR